MTISIPVVFGFCCVAGLFANYLIQKNRLLSTAPIWEHIKRHHHVRDLDSRWGDGTKLQPLLYSEIVGKDAESMEGGKTVLIQGDSWAENMQLVPGARDAWKRYADEQAARIINAGTTSYSPSPITVQLKTLLSKFHVRPQIIVFLIDQTDVGDEACRYADRIGVDSLTGEMIVSPEGPESKEQPQYWQVMIYDLLRQESVNEARKFWEFYKFKISQYLKRESLRIGKARIVYLGTPRCGWSEITKWLKDGNPEDRDLFRFALQRYLREALSFPALECLVLVTHPHRLHIAPLNDERSYVANVSDVVSEIVNSTRDSRLVHLNFTERFSELYGNLTIAEIFQVNDPGSHLMSEAQERLANKIVQEMAIRCP